MTFLEFANHVSSGLLIVTSWFLAHSFSRSIPPGKIVASGFALAGFTVLLTAVGRNLGLDRLATIPWFIVMTKAVLGGTFVFLIYYQYAYRKRYHTGP